jgi:hypothetical protein
MRNAVAGKPLCIVIAGPNGVGKTTFAREFLAKDAGIVRFVNADLIAGGLSPLRPELAALAAGRLFLAELDRLAKARVDFAFETTLSGLVYLGRLKRWKSAGYRVEIVYLRLPSPQLALRRIASRVRQGATMFPVLMFLGGLPVAGTTSWIFTAPLPICGRCMIIQETSPGYWIKGNEDEQRQ